MRSELLIAALLLAATPAAAADPVCATRSCRLSAGTTLWIDRIRDGTSVPSSAHGHRAPCTSIRKTVEFPLSRGDYLVQHSGNAVPSTQLMVTRKPSRGAPLDSPASSHLSRRT
jgi:hypothetical protein